MSEILTAFPYHILRARTSIRSEEFNGVWVGRAVIGLHCGIEEYDYIQYQYRDS